MVDDKDLREEVEILREVGQEYENNGESTKATLIWDIVDQFEELL